MYSKFIIVGNLGADPEMRYTPNGTPVTTFRIATNRRWTDSEGQQREETTWFRVTTWGKLAETCNQYLSKGRQVLVEGDRIQASPYLNRAGEPAASLELTARSVRFLGTRADREEPPFEAPEEMPEEEIPF
jgi:single-strand DNA-binding protein